MRAIVVEHRHELGTLRELPDPAPGDREILVRVAVAGVNPVDWKVRDGGQHPLPYILGQDFAGLVVGVGASVRRYAIDERVFGIARQHGAYADLTVVPEDDHAQPVAKIPDDVGDADAAALPTAGLTALACVERSGVRGGQIVVIVGVTGAVGQFAAQMARDRGARVAGTGSASRADVATALGLDAYVAYDRGDVPASLRSTYPAGVDVVIDLADDEDAIGRMADLLHAEGTIVSTIHSVDEALFGQRGLRGMNVNLVESPQSSHDGLRRLALMVQQGSIRVPIAAEFNLVDAAEALDRQKSGGVAGKIVLTL